MNDEDKSQLSYSEASQHSTDQPVNLNDESVSSLNQSLQLVSARILDKNSY